MNAELFEALDNIEKEKGIPKEQMLENIERALLAAVRRENMGTLPENVRVIVDEQGGKMKLVADKTVVSDINDPKYECSLEEAKKISRKAKLGDTIAFEINTKQFGRISAQTAKQVIIQGIREAERGVVLAEFESKRHEIITGKIAKIDPKNGAVTLEIGRTETILDIGEQVRGESYREGQHIKVYVVDVKENARGPQVVLSRTHPGLVRRLFELEVPEIRDGTVEIKAISREAGSRTKIAVYSNDENVDPVGSCVGAKGARVNNIVEELRGEKIDIIKYDEDPSEFVAAAISPASVISVAVLEDGKSCRVIVPDDQLSLAIGKEGQNARLAAKLTGLKIDIKPLSQITGG